MAIVKPFTGLRPKPELAQKVASPPYDVLTAKEAREMTQNNEISFLRVNKAELEFDDSVDPYSEQVYARGKENLDELIEKGVMIRDSKPSFYLYRLTWQNKSQTGLVALTSVDEYDAGAIKKHEHTRPTKVNDRANHIEHLQAQVGPVFSTFRHDDEIAAIFGRLTEGEPDVSFVAGDGVSHEFWVVSDQPSIEAIQNAFRELKALYIADGHHRSQAASEVARRMREKNPDYTGEEPFNYFLNVLFSDRELRILAYNRVVKDLNGLSHDQFFQKTGEKFDVKQADGPVTPEKPRQFGVYLNGNWWLLEAKEGTYDAADPIESIDAAILQKNLIEPVLGIADPRTDDRIDFVGGIRGTKELVRLVDAADYALAFSLYPTSVDQLLAVADAGEVMPPKSTWFEPKLRSGMVVNMLTD